MAAPTPNDTQADVLLTFPNNLSVRRYRASDAASLSRSADNRKIWAAMRDGFPSPYTDAKANEWVAFVANPANQIASGAWEEGEAGSTNATGSASLVPVHYAITLDDEVVGAIGLMFGKGVYRRTAEIGYWLAEAHWGKGYMNTIVPGFVRWAWTTFGRLVRINVEIHEFNRGSRKVVEKAGFVLEGRVPNALVKDGKLVNAVYYGMLRPGTEEAREI